MLSQSNPANGTVSELWLLCQTLHPQTLNLLLADPEFRQMIADEGMKRYEDLFEWFRLGRIHRLRSLHNGDLAINRSYDIVQCCVVLMMFKDDELNKAKLPDSVKAADNLLNQLGKWWDTLPPNEMVIINNADQIIRGLNDLETLLKHEANNLNMFMLEDVGIYNTNKLIEYADRHLSDNALQMVDNQVKEDFRAAGRCLAFDLFTACGFHAVRALEATARVYYKQFTGKDAQEEGKPLGGIANAFREIADDVKGNPPQPLPKEHPLRLVISNLDRFNHIYRKPLAHPEMVLRTRDAAKNVFDLAAVSIALISEQNDWTDPVSIRIDTNLTCGCPSVVACAGFGQSVVHWRSSEPRTMLLPAPRNAGKGRGYWMGRLSPCTHLNPETGAVGSLRPRLPRPCRPSTKILVSRFVLAGQFLVRQSPSDDLGKRRSEASAVIVLALVVAKRLLVQVAKQMEGLDADVSTFQATLQERPKILDSVRVDIAVHVALRVIDHLMDIIRVQTIVRAPSIGENVRPTLDIFANESLECRAARIGNVTQANFLGFAIQQSHDHGLAATSSASAGDLRFLVLVHEASSAADERLVNLEVANRFFKGAVLHRLADAVEHEPCALLSDAQGARHFARANTILAVGNQPDRGEPFIQPDRRILKDGSDLGAELLLRMFGLALPDAAGRQQSHFRAPASRAGDRAIRPAHRNRRAHAIIRIREVSDRFVKRVRNVSVHAQRIAQYER
jgi:hypothetical protein